MSEQPSFRLSKIAGAAALAFSLAFGLGRYTGSKPVGERASTQTKPSPDAMSGQSLVYKIPVSISQARLGPSDALVTLVQWCDLPDPGCAEAEPAVQAALKRHGKDVRLVFRHFLNTSRADSALAHEFARVAFEQAGKFWEARALLLHYQGEVTYELLEGYTKQLGMNWTHVRPALDEHTHSGHVAADRLFAEMFDVRSTPAFFVNGRPVTGRLTEQNLEAMIAEELTRAKALLAGGVEKENLYAELTKNGVWNRLPKARPHE